MERSKNFVDPYECLLDFDIQRSVGSMLDLANKINEIRWQENEAKYSAKDEAIIEGLQCIKEKMSSESDYDRRMWQKTDC